MAVHSLGYLRLQATDMEAWKVFGGDFLGLMAVEGSNPDALYFRMDEHPPRFVVEPGAESKMTAMGLQVTNKRVLKELVAAVEDAGVKVVEGTEAECAERRVTGFVKFDDPGGNPIELYYGPVFDHVPVQTPTVSTFVTGDQGLGHAIVGVEDGQATFDFYTNVLGFVERNTMRSTWFLGCNPRHHTFGIATRPGPGALLHFMVEAATIDDVGLAIDRAAKHEIPMMLSLGKHTNDHMVSFYVYSPEMYAVEFGWGGDQVPREEPTYEITQGAFWGHKFSPPPGSARRAGRLSPRTAMSQTSASTRSVALGQAAARLVEATTTLVPCEPILDLLPDGTIDDGYAVQQLVIETTKAGIRRVGRKIGLTSPAVQRQMGVETPDFGVLFADMACGDGEPVPTAQLLQPRIEAEVAFVLKSDLPDRPVITTDVLRATDFVVASIEIVDSRIKDWRISIVDTVADNASSGMFVLGGSPRSLLDVDDLRSCDMTLVVRRRDRELRHRGGVPRAPGQRGGVAGQRGGGAWRAVAGRRGHPVRFARAPRRRRGRQDLRGLDQRTRLGAGQLPG